jgi:hypothetical protein
MNPGQPAQPPRKSAFDKDVDFVVISKAGEMFIRNPGPFLVAGLLLVLVPGVAALLFSFGVLGAMISEAAGAGVFGIITFALVSLLFVLIGSAMLTGPMIGSITYMTLKEHDGVRAEMPDIWHGFQNRMGAHIAMYILSHIGMGLGFLCCYFPGMILGGLWMGASASIVEGDGSALDAMQNSSSRLGDRWIMAGLFYWVMTMIMGFGASLGGFLVVLTVPFAYMCMALLYRDLIQPKPIFSIFP